MQASATRLQEGENKSNGVVGVGVRSRMHDAWDLVVREACMSRPSAWWESARDALLATLGLMLQFGVAILATRSSFEPAEDL